MQQKCQFLGTRKLGGMFGNHAKTYIYSWNFEDKAMQAFVLFVT